MSTETGPDAPDATPEPGHAGYRHPEQRTATATARFTPAELDAIQASALLADTTVSVWLRHAALAFLNEGAPAAEIREAALLPGEHREPAAAAGALPPSVADFGPVRFEAMGHRYREGNLSEVVIAGQPFLRLDLKGGAGTEFYVPSSVYCISPGMTPPPVPRTEIPARFGWQAVNEDDDVWDSGDDDSGDDDD